MVELTIKVNLQKCGRIAIPPKIREALGYKEGDKITVKLIGKESQ